MTTSRASEKRGKCSTCGREVVNRGQGWEHVFVVTEGPDKGRETYSARSSAGVRSHHANVRTPRCPVCGGLNPGDMSHTRCA